MHVLLNEMKELAAQKKVPHRDFYNIRKVPAGSWWGCPGLTKEHLEGLRAEHHLWPCRWTPTSTPRPA